MSQKPRLNLVIIGHVDHGKSTTMGHLLYLCGAIDERTLRQHEEEAKKLGKESFKFAWVLDKLKEERERGLTIDLCFLEFETRKYVFTIIDAPGHRDFVKNMITGASQADAAILFVSAKTGEFEAGMSPGGQTREHAYLAFTMGVRQLIVAVNKMDTVNWSQERYEEVREAVSRMLKTIGYKVENIPFVPVSGWTGDNLVKPSDKMPWYKGPTLFEALDMLEPPPKPIDKPLRIPIDEIFSITGIGTVACGRVATGVLKTGDEVIFMPSKNKGTVKSIEIFHKKVPKAVPGDNIGINVKGVSKRDIRPGEVVSHTSAPPPVAREILAKVFVIYHPTVIRPGYTPTLYAHTAHVPARITDILQTYNPKTGQVIKERPDFIRTGDAALVKISLLKPIVLEKAEDIPQLSRFALRDMGTTVAVGVVVDITDRYA